MKPLSDWRPFMRDWAAPQNITATEDESTVTFSLSGACTVHVTAMVEGQFLRLSCRDDTAVNPDEIDGVLDFCNTWNANHFLPTLHVSSVESDPWFRIGDLAAGSFALVHTGAEPVAVVAATVQLPVAASIAQSTFDGYFHTVVAESMNAIGRLHEEGPLECR